MVKKQKDIRNRKIFSKFEKYSIFFRLITKQSNNRPYIHFINKIILADAPSRLFLHVHKTCVLTTRRKGIIKKQTISRIIFKQFVLSGKF